MQSFAFPVNNISKEHGLVDGQGQVIVGHKREYQIELFICSALRNRFNTNSYMSSVSSVKWSSGRLKFRANTHYSLVYVSIKLARLRGKTHPLELTIPTRIADTVNTKSGDRCSILSIFVATIYLFQYLYHSLRLSNLE